MVLVNGACAQALSINSSEDVLVLSDSEIIYDLNSAAQASGFFPCADGFDRENLPSVENLRYLAASSTTRPNFKAHSNQCMYITLRNQTKTTEWVIHVSHFFIETISFALISESDSVPPIYKKKQDVDNQHLNILGKNFPIHVLEDERYLLLLEISADRIGRPPYIGLMSASVYETWSGNMDFSYKVMIGIILGLISVALICSVILRDETFFWFGTSSLCLFSLFFLRSHIVVDFFHKAHENSIWLWLLVALSNISLLMFARSFMYVGSKKDYLIKIFDVAIIFCAITLVFSLFFSNFLSSILFGINGALSIAVISYVACVKLIKEGRYYIIFMLGWLPVLLSIAESIFIMFFVPDKDSSTLSYKNFREPQMQIAHMLIHMVAMFIRVLDLKKQKYLAEIKNEAKSRFLASVSHDLRQPLHSMGMFLAHLNDHLKTDEGQKVFAKVHELHASMNDSFKSLMDLSRLEAGAVTVNKEAIDIERFIKNIALEYETHAQAKGIFLRVRLTKYTVYSDPLLLGRVLRNLLSNAIKYTEKGGVLLAVRIRSNHVLVQVWDTGCGISESDQALIFDIYKRSESNEQEQVGMGIGLSIVKHLSDVMGYPVNVVSVENRGSMFQILLPVDSNTENLIAEYDESQTKCKVRVVLDIPEEHFSKELKEKLGNWNYPVDEAESIRDCVNQNTITLVLSNDDMRLAEMSDPEKSAHHALLVQRAKLYEKKYGVVVVGLFCHNIDQEFIARLKAVNIHVLKVPFRPAQLRSLLRHIEVS